MGGDMFSDRAFNIALAVSFTWHIICVLTVNVVVLPGRYNTRDLTSVSFLGPILEKTALEIMLTGKPSAVTTTYQRGPGYTHSIELKKDIPSGNTVKRHINDDAEENMERALGRVFSRDKEAPEVTGKSGARRPYFGDAGEIGGDLSRRAVIYRPEKPKIPVWAAADAPFKLELEFIVSPQGEVAQVSPAVSSGSPEVDLLAIRYLKRWKFAPFDGSGEGQKGSISFIFER